MNDKLPEHGKKTRFTPENQPKNKGARKSLLAQYIKTNNIGACDIKKVMKNIFFEKTEEEVRQMIADKELPVLVWGICSAFLADCKRGGSRVLKSILEFCYGKPEQRIKSEETLKIIIKPAPKHEKA